MPTYPELAARRERDTRRAAQDVRDAARHRGFDRSAQDLHVKSERAHFAVVGEGSAAAQARYRTAYERIFGARERAR